MFWGDMSEDTINSLMDLALSIEDDTPDFMKNEDILINLPLTWFQCFCVEHCYLSKGTIVSLDTGLGKTMTAMAFLIRTMREQSINIGLFFCLPESVNQIADNFRDYCDITTYKITGTSDDISSLRQLNIIEQSIFIVSYEALYSIKFANWLVDNLINIGVIILDEAHELSQKSLVNSFIKQLCKKVEYKMALTATPITVSPVQIIRLLEFFDEKMISGGVGFLRDYEVRDKNFELIDYKHLDNFSQDIYPRYVSWTRKELGLCGKYHPYLLEVEPTEEQKNCSLKDAYQIIKGDPNSKQAEVFYNLVNYLTSKNKIGLCYAYNREISEELCKHLRAQGIRAFVVNGDIKNKQIREDVIKLFHSGEIDILITNLTMSLNLACDYLIFWQFTNRAVQMLGRCERGFLVKDLDIYLIITKDTVEVEQYQKNVFRRCKWLEESLGKNVDVFRNLSNALGG